MIRINLLAAEKRLKARQSGSRSSWGAVFAVVLVLEVLGLYYWGETKVELLEIKNKNLKQVESELAEIKVLQKQQEELQGKIEEEQIQADILARLKNGREGASNLLLYMAYMLTKPPLENRDERVVQEQLGWTTGWDTERAWFTGLKNSGKGGIAISGEALTHKDTDEVLKRLRSPVYLQHLRLVHSTRNKTKDNRSSTISFKFEAFVNYDPDVGKEPPEEEAAAGSDPKNGRG